MKQIRKRLSYANVMSSVAVFLVLGGGAAFAALGKGTVGTPQLKGNAVTTPKIKRNSVKTGKIALEAVKAGRLAKDAVPTNRLRDSAVNSAKVNESIQKSNDLLFVTVAPANAAAAIKRGRGAQSVTRIGTGHYAVTFDRDIAGCTWLATYGQPNNAGVDALWATTRGRPETTDVGVVLRNAVGAQADGNGFHLAVLCP